MKNKSVKRPRVVLVNRCAVFKKNGKLLLIKRSSSDRYAAGFWEFPGGKLDEGQNVSQALEREVFEETGLVVVPITRIAYIESQIMIQGPYKGLPYIVIIGTGKLIGGKIKLSKEHTSYKWVTKNEALKLPLKDEIRKALKLISKIQ